MKQSFPIIILLSFFTLTNCENVVDCIITMKMATSGMMIDYAVTAHREPIQSL